jgi:hypothetical protein
MFNCPYCNTRLAEEDEKHACHHYVPDGSALYVADLRRRWEAEKQREMAALRQALEEQHQRQLRQVQADHAALVAHSSEQSYKATTAENTAHRQAMEATSAQHQIQVQQLQSAFAMASADASAQQAQLLKSQAAHGKIRAQRQVLEQQQQREIQAWQEERQRFQAQLQQSDVRVAHHVAKAARQAQVIAEQTQKVAKGAAAAQIHQQQAMQLIVLDKQITAINAELKKYKAEALLAQRQVRWWQDKDNAHARHIYSRRSMAMCEECETWDLDNPYPGSEEPGCSIS